MKTAIYGLSLLLALGSGSALAANCQESSPQSNSYTQLSQVQVTGLLEGKTACYPTSAPFENQEAHSGGTITDYKQGPPAPGNNDPTKPVGSYSVNGGIVTYSYGGSYSIYGAVPTADGLYDFCSGGIPLAKGQIKTGVNTPC